MKWRKKEVKINIIVVFVLKRQEVMEFLAIYCWHCDVLSLMNVNLPQMMISIVMQSKVELIYRL